MGPDTVTVLMPTVVGEPPSSLSFPSHSGFTRYDHSRLSAAWLGPHCAHQGSRRKRNVKVLSHHAKHSLMARRRVRVGGGAPSSPVAPVRGNGHPTRESTRAACITYATERSQSESSFHSPYSLHHTDKFL